MLTDSTRKVVEEALGRPLNAKEEEGYPTLADLPEDVIASARKIRDASNSVAACVYLEHVVPSAGLVAVKDFLDDLRTAPKPQLSEDDQAILSKMRANEAARKERYAKEGRAKVLPDDSPIFKKWETDGFLETASGPSAEALLEQLASNDPRKRASALQTIASSAIADARVLAAGERLLEDRTLTVIGMPSVFGEVRWVAADAVAATRRALGRSEPVIIENVAAPVVDVRMLAVAVGIPMESGVDAVDSAIKTLERLSSLGKLPRQRIERN